MGDAYEPLVFDADAPPPYGEQQRPQTNVVQPTDQFFAVPPQPAATPAPHQTPPPAGGFAGSPAPPVSVFFPFTHFFFLLQAPETPLNTPVHSDRKSPAPVEAATAPEFGAALSNASASNGDAKPAAKKKRDGRAVRIGTMCVAGHSFLVLFVLATAGGVFVALGWHT